MQSNLSLLNACDTFPAAGTPAHAAAVASLVRFRVASHLTTLGYVRTDVAAAFAAEPGWQLDAAGRTLTLMAGAAAGAGAMQKGQEADAAEARSKAVAETLARMRAAKRFAVLAKWRDEQYAVYGAEPASAPLLLTLERAAAALLGVVTYGAHLTAYARSGSAGGGLRLWVPRRSRTKQTFPGMLDNSVAGGLSAGESPWESLMRECAEEASLPRAVAERARAAGCVTYFYVTAEGSAGEHGLMQPECQFVYDLDLTDLDEVVLRPCDGEVEGFEVMDVDQVKRELALGHFKPNCAVVMLDFLIRHGLLTVESEPDYIEISSRIHRILEFPLAKFAHHS